LAQAVCCTAHALAAYIQAWRACHAACVSLPLTSTSRCMPAAASFAVSLVAAWCSALRCLRAGVAIGNGLTDPRSQTMALSRTASQIGMVSTAQSVLIDDKISEVGGML
jgi:hypothetical protein